MLLLLAAALTIPPGLDLYLPVPEENPITPGKIEAGRRLFFDRRLSRDVTIGRTFAIRAAGKSLHVSAYFTPEGKLAQYLITPAQ